MPRTGSADTPFLYAAAEGRLEILRLILATGSANLADTNRYGGTGLIPAAHHGHPEVVRELLKTKIAIDHVNRLGWTALLETIILSDGGPVHQDILQQLIAAGADVNLAEAGRYPPHPRPVAGLCRDGPTCWSRRARGRRILPVVAAHPLDRMRHEPGIAAIPEPSPAVPCRTRSPRPACPRMRRAIFFPNSVPIGTPAKQ